jgi:hypothetical protein
MEAKIYPLSATLNGKINLQKIDLEIRASTIELYETPAYLFKGMLYVEFSGSPSEADVTQLEEIIAGHDGEDASVSEAHVNEREEKIRELTQMAIFHPLLDNTETVEYLTSIDNWFNAWKRSGIETSLVSKIASDALSGTHPQDTFLNTVVNPEGNKCFEFLISVIQS